MGAETSRRAASTFGRFSKLALKPRRMFLAAHSQKKSAIKSEQLLWKIRYNASA